MARVIDQAGTPVAGAIISVIDGTVQLPEMAIRTDADGRFRLRLPAGRFVLEVVVNGESKRVEVQSAGDPQQDLLLEI